MKETVVMKCSSRCVYAVSSLLLLIRADVILAQEKTQEKQPPTQPAAAAPAAADANRPASAEYQRQFEDWKNILKDLRKLKVNYQSAALADQAKIQQEWKDQVEKGNQIVAALEAAGLKAYEEAPNEDPQLTRFLVKLAD